MSAASKANAAKYLQTQVKTASREQLVVMLFDGAVRFASEAKEHMANKCIEDASKRIIRVQDILLELIVSLNHEEAGEITGNLAAIYGYLYMRMVDANEYKRRQAAPAIKVTTRAFGTGRRMPIAQRYVQGG